MGIKFLNTVLVSDIRPEPGSTIKILSPNSITKIGDPDEEEFGTLVQVDDREGKERITLKGSNTINFSNYISTSSRTSLGSINPIQNFYPDIGNGQDTTTDLGVDQSGQVVRTTQEATISMSASQVNSLTTSVAGTTLLLAPGSNKFVIVEKVTFMLFFSSNTAMSATQKYEIRQDSTASDVLAVLNGAKINNMTSNGSTVGLYEHDTGFSSLNRVYSPNKTVTINRTATSNLPESATKLIVKIRYRVYDSASF